MSEDAQNLILFVVGSRLQAEEHDRPVAYDLREVTMTLIDQLAPTSVSLKPILCSDIWYLNQSALHSQPTIAIGGPRYNAAACRFAKSLPTVLAVNDLLQIHLDIDGSHPRAAAYGINAAATAQAIELFRTRYLTTFIQTTIRRLLPHDQL